MVQVQQRVLAFACLLCLSTFSSGAPRFYPDDPLLREPPPLPVPHLKSREINDYFDFFQDTFFEPDKAVKKLHDPPPSQAVNTLGEVPDSSWFTNRIGSRPMSIGELARGPGDSQPPAVDRPWTVISGKNEGVTPGLVIRDSAGRKYFLKFDPKSNPEMSSAADVIGSKFFYDIGYNTPQNYIVVFDRGQLALGNQSTYAITPRRKRPMLAADIDDILREAPPDKNGRYRAIASLEIPGRPIGPFLYNSTRPDDPNDIVDHENRRDLRGLYVFAAWLNHTDAKSINSLDTLVEEAGIPHVRHFLIDFGSILGSDSFEGKSPRAGHVYLFDFKAAAWQFLSLGLYVPDWMSVRYPQIPEAGRLDYQSFDPEHWKNNYPNPAFDLRTPGDTFWAAKKVMAFSDEAIRAIVETGRYSDPRATEWVTQCLIERRNKIGRAFFSDVLPLDGFAVRNGRLTFEDLAVKYGFHAPRPYSVVWSVFDNESGARTPIAGAVGFEAPRSPAPYLAAEIRSVDPGKTVTVYLRGGREVVGIDRTW